MSRTNEQKGCHTQLGNTKMSVFEKMLYVIHVYVHASMCEILCVHVLDAGSVLEAVFDTIWTANNNLYIMCRQLPHV